jgi:photolyase PhrII
MPSAAGPADLLSHLSPHLRPRVGGPAHPRPPAPGAFVLYWMRTAVRGHENPALDAALEAGRTLGLPVFVYHALSASYPHASHRHHVFILEGARDAHRELAARGIPHAFHLERPGHRGPHLLTLARQASVVVTEVMPVPFLRRWTRILEAGVDAPVWNVDAATLSCVYRVPRSATDRAFRFRQAATPLWRPWLRTPWPEVAPEAARLSATPAPAAAAGWRPAHLPFDPVPVGELDDGEIADLVATCDVDPTVGPVPHTRGGARAGYARWAAFRDGHLDRYARDRNDPLRNGVSRMSAYLHYGHVSPFRLAREAHARGTDPGDGPGDGRTDGRGVGRGDGEGARKYLDELLTWRELAWAWCHHREDPESLETLEALPAWARATLRAHASDPRPVLHGRESLARGRTGAPLWDAAQASLRIHGELHNNVRMTWGKALVSWTPGPEEALAALVDLNHRFALDGRDPGSYGGLLWCLGAFDRPFDPPRAILGTVRPRDPEDHAARLDVERWGAVTGRPAVDPAPTVAVVGAGVAGLTAARILADHGLRVRIWDKGSAAGGRLSTRRSREGWSMDHGAPFFTARDPVFRRQVRGWAEAGVVAPWNGRIGYLARGSVPEPATETTRWVGIPGMQVLAGHLARDLDLRTGVQVAPLAPPGTQLDSLAGAGAWSLEGTTADLVLVTAPPAQAAALLERAHPAFAARLASLPMRPCWSVMARLEPAGAGGSILPWDALFVEHEDGPDGGDPEVFRWVARDSSKPGRRAPGADHWVLHASPAWSERNLEEDPERVARDLVEAFRALVRRAGRAGEGDGFRVLGARAHRWRYSIPGPGSAAPADGGSDAPGSPGAPLPYLWDPEAGVGVAGDALGGGRVEGAFRSGAALAGRVLLSIGAGSLPR